MLCASRSTRYCCLSLYTIRVYRLYLRVLPLSVQTLHAFHSNRYCCPHFTPVPTCVLVLISNNSFSCHNAFSGRRSSNKYCKYYVVIWSDFIEQAVSVFWSTKILPAIDFMAQNMTIQSKFSKMNNFLVILAEFWHIL